MPFASNRGVNIYYETAGDGPPMVLVHANPFDHRLFTYQIASFAPHFRIVALDIRGYGRSDKPVTPFTLEDMADDVLAVCAQEKIARAIFMGVSVGSGMSLLIGLDHPEMCDAIILVGGSSKGGADIAGRVKGYTSADLRGYQRSHIRELVAPGFCDTKLGAWVLDLFSDKTQQLSGECIAQIFRAREACDMRDRLGGMKPPTLVINGEHDVSLKRGGETASMIPGAKHVVLPGTGHACCIEDPAAFDGAVIDFLKASKLWSG
ncbi:MAG: alpha/beta hydrolase [Xanthobacteraceae bacterium]|nr:alpha/beta hydrolase [Xanthobacteraceae bacterium]